MVIGAFERGIETARERILLDLAVPLIGHELLKPMGKPGQFGSRKVGNNGFNFFNAHARRLTQLSISRSTFPTHLSAHIRELEAHLRMPPASYSLKPMGW